MSPCKTKAVNGGLSTEHYCASPYFGKDIAEVLRAIADSVSDSPDEWEADIVIRKVRIARKEALSGSAQPGDDKPEGK